MAAPICNHDPMAFDGIVFDLFHTLIDPDPLRPAGFDYRSSIADHLGLDRAAFATYWDGTYVERETTTIDLGDLVERYAASVGIEVTPADRLVFDGWFGVAKDESILRPPPDLVDLVTELSRGTKVGVLSNCYEREVRYWPASPYAPLVDSFVGSCFIGVMKPDEVAYATILSELGLEPSSTVFVGNGGGAELGGASRFGFGLVVHMNAFDRLGRGVTPDEQRQRSEVADVSIDQVDELGPLLRSRSPAWFS